MGKYKRTALGTLVERTTRYTILVPLNAKDAPGVRKAYAKELDKLPKEIKLLGPSAQVPVVVVGLITTEPLAGVVVKAPVTATPTELLRRTFTVASPTKKSELSTSCWSILVEMTSDEWPNTVRSRSTNSW